MTNTAPDAPPGTMGRWLNGIALDELEIIEFGGGRLYAETIKQKNPKTGELKEVPVYVRIPSTVDLAQSTIDAINWVGKLAKRKDLDLKGARAIVGDLRFEDMDTVCVLSYCIREREAPHGRYMLPALLDENHSRQSLFDLWDRLDFYMRLENPRVGEVDDERFWQIVIAIDKRRNLSPLVALDGSSRDSFLLSMAVRLQSFRMGSSSSPSTEPSTQEP